MGELEDNVRKLKEAGVPDDQIVEFIRKFDKGQKAKAQLESYQPIEDRPYRDAAVMGGGALGGMLASPGGVTTPLGVGLGAGIAGQLYDFAEEAAGQRQPRPPLQRTLDAASDVGINTLAPAATSKILGMTGQGLSKMISPIRNWTAQATAPQLSRDFAALGVRPDAGAISGNPAIQMAQKGMSFLPGSTTRMFQHSKGVVDDIGRASRELAESYGPVMTREGAGDVAMTGLRRAAERYGARAETLWDNVRKFTEPGQKVSVSNTLEFLRSQKDRLGTAEESKKLLNTGIKKISKAFEVDAADGTMDYVALDSWRKDIGAALGRKSRIFDDVDTGKLKRLYAALSDDIRQVFPDGTPARKAAERARLYTKMFHDHNEKVISDLLRKASPGKIADAISSSAKTGGVELSRIKRNLTADEWDVVVASYLDRMGKAVPSGQNVTGEVFSPSTFMSHYSKLKRDAPKTLEVLFGGSRYSKLKPELDRLINVAGSVKDIEKMANPSGTTTGMNIAALFQAFSRMAVGTVGATAGALAGTATAGPLGGVPGAVAGIGGLVYLPHKLSQLWTSPGFVRWLANGVKLSKVRGANDLSSHVGRLAAVIQSEPEMKEAINAYVHELNKQR